MWDLTSLVCSAGGTPVPATQTASIHLDPGVNVTCTFTNTEHRHSSITIVNDAVPDSGQDFSFYTGGNGLPGTFSLDDDADATLPNTVTYDGLVEGDYTVAETSGRRVGSSRTSCARPAAGPTSRTALRRSISTPARPSPAPSPTRARGSITIVKDAVPDDAQDFAFTTGGAGLPASFSLDDDADATLSNTRTFTNLAPGGYSVTEAAARRLGPHAT